MGRTDGLYADCARRAREWVDSDAGASATHELVKNAGNLELYAFLREIRDSLNRHGIDSPLSKSLPGALRSLSACLWRACTPDLLLKLKGFGAKTVAIISNSLWKDSPPEEEDEEEKEFREQCEAEEKQQIKAQKAAAKQSAAAAAAAIAAATAAMAGGPAAAAGIGGGMGGGLPGLSHAAGSGGGAGRGNRLGGPAAPQTAGHDPLEALRSALGENVILREAAQDAVRAWQQQGPAAAGGSGGGLGINLPLPTGARASPAAAVADAAARAAAAAAAAAEARSRKRAAPAGGGAAGGGEGGGSAAKKPRATKPKAGAKLPSPGTGNYAVLAVLYMSYKRGEPAMVKEAIVSAIEALPGLADVTMRQANSWSVSAKDRYCGWSNVNKGLINREPPLVSKHSSPAKFRLVLPHGLLAAASIYKDAVARGRLGSVPGLDPEGDIQEQQAAVDALNAAAAASGATPPAGGSGGGGGGTPAGFTGYGLGGEEEEAAAVGGGRGRGRGGGRGRGRGRGAAAAAAAASAAAAAAAADEPRGSQPTPRTAATPASGGLGATAGRRPSSAAGMGLGGDAAGAWWGGEDDPSLYAFDFGLPRPSSTPFDSQRLATPAGSQPPNRSGGGRSGGGGSAGQRARVPSRGGYEGKEGAAAWTSEDEGAAAGAAAAAAVPPARRRRGSKAAGSDEDWEPPGAGCGGREFTKPARRQRQSGSNAAAAGGGGGGEGAGGDGMDVAAEDYVSPQLVDSLVDMGFSRSLVSEALRRCCGSVEAAAEWLLMGGGGEEEGADADPGENAGPTADALGGSSGGGSGGGAGGSGSVPAPDPWEGAAAAPADARTPAARGSGGGSARGDDAIPGDTACDAAGDTGDEYVDDIVAHFHPELVTQVQQRRQQEQQQEWLSEERPRRQEPSQQQQEDPQQQQQKQQRPAQKQQSGGAATQPQERQLTAAEQRRADLRAKLFGSRGGSGSRSRSGSGGGSQEGSPGSSPGEQDPAGGVPGWPVKSSGGGGGGLAGSRAGSGVEAPFVAGLGAAATAASKGKAAAGAAAAGGKEEQAERPAAAAAAAGSDRAASLPAAAPPAAAGTSGGGAGGSGRQASGQLGGLGSRQPSGQLFESQQSSQLSGGCWASDSWEPLPWRVPLLGAPDGLTPRLPLPPLPPGVAFSSVYEVVVVVDQREQMVRGNMGRNDALERHLADLRRLGVPVEKAHLNCGDMLWVARPRVTGVTGVSSPGDAYVLDFVAERKSVQDLYLSITGGRYANQKVNMRSSGLGHLLYIVEGHVEGLRDDTGRGRQAVRTSMMETAVHDGFTVLETEDHHATLRLLADVTRTLSALYGPLTAASAPPGAPHAPRLSTWNEERRDSYRRRTVRDVWLLMLAELPGFGTIQAQKVLSAFPTPRSVFDAFAAAMANAAASGGDALRAARGVLREHAGLSEAKSKQVFDELFASGWHVV